MFPTQPTLLFRGGRRARSTDNWCEVARGLAALADKVLFFRVPSRKEDLKERQIGRTKKIILTGGTCTIRPTVIIAVLTVSGPILRMPFLLCVSNALFYCGLFLNCACSKRSSHVLLYTVFFEMLFSYRSTCPADITVTIARDATLARRKISFSPQTYLVVFFSHEIHNITLISLVIAQKVKCSMQNKHILCISPLKYDGLTNDNTMALGATHHLRAFQTRPFFFFHFVPTF